FWLSCLPCFFLFCQFLFFRYSPPYIYLLSLHDALPISCRIASLGDFPSSRCASSAKSIIMMPFFFTSPTSMMTPTNAYTESSTRSEEHTSELQSPDHLVCRLLLEKTNPICLLNPCSWPA